MQFDQIEYQRAAREELERIKYALEVRLVKSPEILMGGHPSARIGALIALEARALLERYKLVYSTLKSVNYSHLEREEALQEYKDQTFPLKPDPHAQLAEKYTLLEGGIDQYRCAYTKNLNIDMEFSPSEHYGRFLDLHSTHAILAAKETPISYFQYLHTFPQLDSHPEHLQAVNAYLTGFFARTRVFEDPPQPEINSELYCKVCQRHYATKGVFDGHMKGRKHLRALKTNTPQPDTETLRAKIRAYTAALSQTLADTIADLKRQTALTDKERRAEVESIVRQIHSEDNASPQTLAIPQPEAVRDRIGPDGKPVPQWLYRLKGLGHEYQCEVCGNYTYHGRQAFDRHFDETRHTHGLKCLGVGAHPLYRGITEIRQVLELAAKNRKKRIRDDAEVEDDEGNVMTERVYKDLKRQNLI